MQITQLHKLNSIILSHIIIIIIIIIIIRLIANQLYKNLTKSWLSTLLMAFEVSHGMHLDSLRDTIQGSVDGKFEWICHFCKNLSMLAWRRLLEQMARLSFFVKTQYQQRSNSLKKLLKPYRGLAGIGWFLKPNFNSKCKLWTLEWSCRCCIWDTHGDLKVQGQSIKSSMEHFSFFNRLMRWVTFTEQLTMPSVLWSIQVQFNHKKLKRWNK